MSESTSSAADPAAPRIRIGHADRAAATAALDVHLAAGRLDAEEYGDRVATAALARTRDELDPLFTDLPEPRPFGTGARAMPTAARSRDRRDGSRPVGRPGQGRDYGRLVRDGFARSPVLASLVLLLAVVLAVPVLTALVVLTLVFDRRGLLARAWSHHGRG